MIYDCNDMFISYVFISYVHIICPHHMFISYWNDMFYHMFIISYVHWHWRWWLASGVANMIGVYMPTSEGVYQLYQLHVVNILLSFLNLHKHIS